MNIFLPRAQVPKSAGGRDDLASFRVRESSHRTALRPSLWQCGDDPFGRLMARGTARLANCFHWNDIKSNPRDTPKLVLRVVMLGGMEHECVGVVVDMREWQRLHLVCIYVCGSLYKNMERTAYGHKHRSVPAQAALLAAKADGGLRYA